MCRRGWKAGCRKRKMKRMSESPRGPLTSPPGTADLNNAQPHTRQRLINSRVLTPGKCFRTLLKPLNLFIQQLQEWGGAQHFTHTD